MSQSQDSQEPSQSSDSTSAHIYPHRKIFFPNDLPQLYWSGWFTNAMQFLLTINIHLRAKTLQDIKFDQIPVQYVKLTELLNTLLTEIDRHPPHHQNQRFGNTAFREWFDPVQGIVTEAMQEMVQLSNRDDSGYSPEIGVMLGDYRESLQMHLNWKNGAKIAVQVKPTASTQQFDEAPLNVFKRKKSIQQQQAKAAPPATATAAGAASAPLSPSLQARNSASSQHLPLPAPLSISQPHVAQRANPLTQHSVDSTTPRQTPKRVHNESSQDASMPNLSLGDSSVATCDDKSPSQDCVVSASTEQEFPPLPRRTSVASNLSNNQSLAPSIANSILPSLSAASYANPGEPSEQNISLPCSLSQELTGYFLETLGNYIRIDYGTGHELAFITFLSALQKSGVLPISTQNEAIYVALVIFDSYLKLVRRLQLIYWLEPAGSKGAWGLDDYQFVCFLWGSSQFIHFKEEKQLKKLPSISDIFNTPTLHEKLGIFSPKDFTEDESSDAEESQETRGLLFIEALKFVHQTKPSVALQHSSPILYSLSQMNSWDVINQYLLRMYGNEVIAKFPVMQHVKFGALMPCDGIENFTRYQHEKDQKEPNAQVMAWFTNTTKLHNLFRIPPTILDVTNDHLRNVKMDAALVVRKR